MKTIAIVAGGDSSEYEISVKSAGEVSKSIEGKYDTYVIMVRGQNWYWEDAKGMYHNIDKNDFTLKTGESRIRFDGVFIAIHGTPGENGLLQGYFDMLKIPYSSCSAFTSALTFNKQATKLYLKEYNIKMAENLTIRKGEPVDFRVIENTPGFPCFVKPNDSGSSFGVSKVKSKDDLPPALEKAFRESEEVMIESFMKGREVACGVVKTKNRKIVLPVTEIISKNEFFDYEAKYIPGNSQEVTPADLPQDITEEVQRLSSLITDILGCKGIVRVDYIIVSGKPWFLEINTVPGMTQESLIPQQARAASIPVGDLYSMVIEDMLA
jgi:D-alanine-D-alanine ligase